MTTEKKQEWSLHFHRTINTMSGTKDLDVYTLHKSGAKTYATVMVDHKDPEQLMQQIMHHMNSLVWMNHEHHDLLELNAMFHGPWTRAVSGIPFLALTEPDIRKIKSHVFKVGAERDSLQAQYEILRDDYSKMAKNFEILQQEVLRTHGRSEAKAPERPTTVADLLEAPLDDVSQLEIPEFACRKDILAKKRGTLQ